jgi:hypothetical protein
MTRARESLMISAIKKNYTSRFVGEAELATVDGAETLRAGIA